MNPFAFDVFDDQTSLVAPSDPPIPIWASFDMFGDAAPQALSSAPASRLAAEVSERRHARGSDAEPVQHDLRDDSPDSKKQPKCFICLGAMSRVARLPCGHMFCTECITGWVGCNRKCPHGCSQDITLSQVMSCATGEANHPEPVSSRTLYTSPRKSVRFVSDEQSQRKAAAATLGVERCKQHNAALTKQAQGKRSREGQTDGKKQQPARAKRARVDAKLHKSEKMTRGADKRHRPTFSARMKVIKRMQALCDWKRGLSAADRSTFRLEL